MKCPVCQADGLPDELDQCPQCESRLDVFHLTRRIAQARNRLFSITVVMAIVLVAVILYWLLSAPGTKPPENPAVDAAISENASLKAELNKVNGERDRLLKEVAALKQAPANNEETPAKRTKEYVVQNGETLFGIARKVYGNGFRYKDLARDNNLQDPSHIYTGQKLIIYY